MSGGPSTHMTAETALLYAFSRTYLPPVHSLLIRLWRFSHTHLTIFAGVDIKFLQKAEQTVSNPHFIPRQKNFTIKHYAGDVTYDVEGMGAQMGDRGLLPYPQQDYDCEVQFRRYHTIGELYRKLVLDVFFASDETLLYGTRVVLQDVFLVSQYTHKQSCARLQGLSRRTRTFSSRI